MLIDIGHHNGFNFIRIADNYKRLKDNSTFYATDLHLFRIWCFTNGSYFLVIHMLKDADGPVGRLFLVLFLHFSVIYLITKLNGTWRCIL